MMNITIKDGECTISGIDYNGYAFELHMYSSEWRVIREHIEKEAVLAERRNVWDVLNALQKDLGSMFMTKSANRLKTTINILFPDGEPI